MADLISRSELLKIIEDEEKELPLDAEKYHIDKNVVDGMKASLIAIKNIVTEQQTAYDVEKVVEQLEQQAEQYHRRADEYAQKGVDRQCEHMAGKACSYEYAIEIVKAGGLNE